MVVGRECDFGVSCVAFDDAIRDRVERLRLATKQNLLQGYPKQRNLFCRIMI